MLGGETNEGDEPDPGRSEPLADQDADPRSLRIARVLDSGGVSTVSTHCSAGFDAGTNVGTCSLPVALTTNQLELAVAATEDGLRLVERIALGFGGKQAVLNCRAMEKFYVQKARGFEVYMSESRR